MARKKKEEPKILPTTKKEKQQALNKLMKQFNKKHANSNLIKGKEVLKDRPRISFGVKEIDELTGGGIPKGLFSVIWGSKSAGKTTLVYNIIAQAQKNGDVVAFFDLENTFDPDWACQMGVDVDDMVLGYFETAEETLDALVAITEAGAVDLVVIDSIQAMSPKGEQQNKSGTTRSIAEDEMALLARKLSKFFRIAAPRIHVANTAVLLIGQARMDLGSFIVLEKLSGGRCFDEKTRILTKDGYKTYKEIKEGDLIPTINFETNKIEYKPIKKIFVYDDYKGNVVRFHNKYGAEFVFTPNHQCLVKQFKNGSLIYPVYKNIYAEEKRRTYAFPNCFLSGNPEYPISDDEIRFLAWCLTDSKIDVKDKTATNWRKYADRIMIYQTKHHKRIEDLLNRLNLPIGLEFTVRKKERKVDYRPEFKNTKPSYEFYIKNAKIYIEKYKLTRDKLLPDWMFDLSDRQARIFFEEIIYADGSIKKGKIRSLHKGSIEWLERIQYFLATHNIPTSKIKKQPTKKCWTLYFQSADYVGVERNQQEIIKNYVGLMWDIEVDNHYHFIERNHKLIITHNSLEHWSSLTIKLRRGQKSDAPAKRIKDEDGKSKKTIVGFDCVVKIEKTKIKSATEGTEIHVPFYFDGGFKKTETNTTEEIDK